MGREIFMKAILEILRIIIIIIVLGALGSWLISYLYKYFDVPTDKDLTGTIGVYILLFVLYRNKLQFNGWYKGNGRHKLSKRTTRVLIGMGFAFIIAPIILNLVRI